LTYSAQTTAAGTNFSDIRPRPAGSGIPSKEQIQSMLDRTYRFLFIDSMDQLYGEIAQSVMELFSAEHVIVWIADEDGKHRPKVAMGYAQEVAQEIMSLSHGEDYDAEVKKVANWIGPLSYFVPAEAKKHIGWDSDHLECMSHTAADAKPRSAPDSWHDLDHLNVSMVSRDGKFLGSIAVCKTVDGKIPSTETVKAMEIFSSICSVAMGLVGQREKKTAIAVAAEGQSSQISQVLSFAREVLSLESPEKVFDSILMILRDLFGFKSASISLLDEREDCFRYFALMGYPPNDMEYAKTIRIPPESYKFYVRSEFLVGRDAYYIPAEQLPDENLLWEVYSPEDFSDIKKRKMEPRAFPGAWHPQDNLLFAIHDNRGRVIGLLCPDNPADGKLPSPETVDGMGIFTSLASIALENSKYYSEIIRAKEEIDILNGLLFRDVSKINAEIREYLEEAASPEITQEQRVKYIRGAMNMLDSIIELIHKVRRISSVRSMSPGDLLRLDLVDAIRSQMSRVIGQQPGRKVKGIFESMPSNCYVLANDLIGELFSNILKNAIVHNYSEEAEICVSVNPFTDEFKNKAYWDVSISDNGPGIPDERKARIFNLVTRIDEPGERTGVGLSMVKSIATLYGGSTWVENRVSLDHTKGSTFHVLLPAA